MRAAIPVWCARAVWVLLPITGGAALTDATADWTGPTAGTATTIAWTAWALGLLALVAPRPWGLTGLRVLAPALAIGVVLAAGAASGIGRLALPHGVIAAALALSAPVAAAAANALAYGDEVRYPLRVPAPLLALPVPLAAVATSGAVIAGPMLLAAGRPVAGVVAIAVGVPLAVVLMRSLHALSRRWFVLVPAGITFVDPMTLGEPTLVRHADIAGVKQVAAGLPPGPALDLRLGTPWSGVAVGFATPQPFARRRGRKQAELIEADAVVVSVVGARRLAFGRRGRAAAE